MTPPIPARLVRRPTVGGLVVPWIAVHDRDGRATLGAVDRDRVSSCLLGRLCQTCGHRLGSRVVLFARPQDFAHGYVAEPGMHPECAAYSARACPMLTGAMDHYRSTPRHVPGRVPGDDQQARSGAPADPYYQVWIRLDDYHVVQDTERAVQGIALPEKPLKVRLLSGGNPTAEQLTRILMHGLPWPIEPGSTSGVRYVAPARRAYDGAHKVEGTATRCGLDLTDTAELWQEIPADQVTRVCADCDGSAEQGELL